MHTKRGLLALAAAIALLPTAALAQGRVGVTSQTEGDPLGRPPAAAERILRVGIDIQANEVVTTKNDDRAHLVFLDGTALTVAPNAQLVIDKFVYDPNAKTGQLAISVTTGVFRLVGGKISKESPITIKTPSATMGVRGGIGMFTVTPGQTTADFLYGNSLSVTANGRTETATRPGSMIVTTLGGSPGAPVLIPSGALAQIVAALETRVGGKTTAPDDKARQSGFAARNSGQNFLLNQGAANQQNQANNAAEAVSTVNQQRDVLTTQVVATPTAPPATVVPPPSTPAGPPAAWCPPPTHHHRHGQPIGGR